MLLTYCWMKQTELECLLTEIVDCCRCLLELLFRIDEKYNVNLGQHFSRDNLRMVKSIPDENRLHRTDWCSSVCTSIIRREFMHDSRLGLYYRKYSSQSQAIDTIEYMIDEQSDIDEITRLIYEILEKYYLSIRLFLIYSGEQKHILGIWAASSWPFTFGLTILCVMYFKQTNSFGIELIILVLVGMLISNVLVGIPANFNAKVSALD